MNAPYTPRSLHPAGPGRPDDDWLDAVLREDARAHIDDDGFTSRVSAALPPRRAGSHVLLRRFLPAGMTALAAGMAFFVLPGSDLFLDGFADLMVSDVTSPRALAVVATGAVFAWLAITGVAGES